MLRRSAPTLAILLLIGLCPGASATADGAAPGVKLDYALYVGGVGVLDFSASYRASDVSYRLHLKAATEGFLGQVANWSADISAEGRRLPGELPRPALYRSISSWRDKPRNTTVEYGADGQPTVTVADPPPSKDREPVPPELRRETVDPLSAVVAVLADVAEGRGCGRTVPVFDGRQRYDLIFADGADVTLAPTDVSAYSGSAVSCAVQYRSIAGRWREDTGRRDRDDEGRSRRRNAQDVRVWIAPPGPDLRPVPVKLEANTPLGRLVIHLSKATPETKAAALP